MDDGTGASDPTTDGPPAEGQPGWALGDTAAAVAYGAPVAARIDHALDFFVPDRSILRRAVTLLGVSATPALAGVTHGWRR